MRTLLWILAQLPLAVVHGMGALAGVIFDRLPNRARATTYRNIENCFPEMDESAIAAMARESLKNTACTALEMGKAWIWAPEKIVALTVATEGYEAYRAALASGEGVILLAPHLSNWEIFGYFAIQHVPATFMYQPPRSAAMDRILREGRTKSGVTMAPTTRKGVAQVLAALNRGELVGVLPDQVPAEGSGEFATFFGQPAYTMTLVTRLVQRTGARVFCGFGQRLPAGRGFKAIFQEAHPALYSDQLAESVEGLNRSVEALVELAPSQYQWEYKRFRKQPDNREFY